MQRVTAIAAMSGFAIPQWWLTFYLTGNPGNLERMAERLAVCGAVNLCGAESGFTYPKLGVASDAATVAQAVAEVQQLAVITDVMLLSVDVDTSPNVECSSFRELIRFNSTDS